MTTTIAKSIEKDDKNLFGDDNPIAFQSEEIDRALLYIIKAAVIAAKKNDLDTKETDYVVKLVKRAYQARKAKHFFEFKSNQLGRTLQLMRDFIVHPNESENFSHVYYYNKTKQFSEK